MIIYIGLPWWLSGKESACQVGDTGSIPGLGRSTGGENGNPLQNSCLGNPADRGAWWTTVHGVERVGYDGAHMSILLLLSIHNQNQPKWASLVNLGDTLEGR